MIRLIFLILIFLITHEKVEANCTGYCENENFEIITYEIKGKLKGAKKTAKVFSEVFYAKPKDSHCDIFYTSHERLKSKKKDKNSQPIYSSYGINRCDVCSKSSIVAKDNKTGFCPFPMFKYDVIYKKAFKWQSDHQLMSALVQIEKLLKEGDGKTIIGRSETGDINKDIIDATKNIHTEFISFAITPKKRVYFFNKYAKDWSQGDFVTKYKGRELIDKKYWFYIYAEFKTASMDQVIKISDMNLIEEEDVFGNEIGKPLINYLENFIFEIQNKTSNYFSPKSKDYNDISKLLSLIPSKEELSIFNDDILEVFEDYANFEKYHIQTRN